MNLFGPPDVEKMKARRDVNGLIKALGYQKGDSWNAKNIRHYAAHALGELGDPRAVEPLIAALGDSDFMVRMFAAEALAKIGNRRAVEPLSAALRAEPLIAALQEEEWDVRKTAAEALISIYRQGQIKEVMKAKILAMRDKIAAMHRDAHTDKSSDCDNHWDSGVENVKFLL